MSDLFDECPDDTYLDFPCFKCGGDVGHLINCPDGSAFSGDRKTIMNNPFEREGKMECFSCQDNAPMENQNEHNTRPLDEFVILRHPNCRYSRCEICMEDHEELGKILTKLTMNDKIDHLGKYHLWLSKHGIEPETEWGWATPETFLRENIERYVNDFMEG